MKIVSPFRDYYDHAVHASQIDPTIVFLRRTSLANAGPISRPQLHHVKTRQYKITNPEKTGDFAPTYLDFSPQMAMLTVGAKAFPLLMVHYGIHSTTLSSKREAGLPNHMRHASSNDYVAASTWDRYIKMSLARRNSSLDPDLPNATYERYHRLMNPRIERELRNEELQLQAAFEAVRNFDATEFCMHHQTPLTLTFGNWPFQNERPEAHGVNARNWFTMRNPPLNLLNAFEVIDAFQVWQECSMFIGGVMPGRQSPMVEVSNDTKIEKAGFDRKISFRKRPETER